MTPRSKHPIIREYKEKVSAARYQIGVSQAAYLPQVQFLSYFNYGLSTPTGTQTTATTTATSFAVPTAQRVAKDYYVYRFQMNQLIYDFGKTLGQIGQSRATYHQTEDDYTGTRQKVVLDARSAFFGLLAAQRAAKVTAENVRLNQDLVKQAMGFYKVGLKAKIDVTTAEAKLYDAEASNIRAKNQVDLARVSLMTALGLKTWPYKEIEDVMEVAHQAPSLAELKAQALRQRPEVVKNIHTQDFYQQAYRTARAGFLPSLTSSAAWGWQGAEEFLPTNKNWYVGVSLTMPLFDGLLALNNVRVARANQRATLADAEVLQQDVAKEVEQAYLDVKTYWELIRSTKKAMEAARENFRLAQGRYQVGVGSIIEVTDAQVQYFQSELKYVQALYDYRINEAKLDKAIGKAF